MKVSQILLAITLCVFFLVSLSLQVVLPPHLSRERMKKNAFLRGHSIDDEHNFYEKIFLNPQYKNKKVELEKLNGETVTLTENDNPFQDSGFYNVNKTVGGMMYYVFFEAKNKNPKAPIILWLQGGPGCSSMTGLFVELGPYKINRNSLKLIENPNTWNNDYHMLFIDNPLG
jgi:carboxypeptidase C (cathepsin A)